jgi:hypothetical protein
VRYEYKEENFRSVILIASIMILLKSFFHL